ncbi:hypothetical protein WDU94_006770 [Cyamophila willieti]
MVIYWYVIASLIGMMFYYLKPVWYSLYFTYVRPLFKWILRKTTRLCELQRICYGESHGAKRSLGIEYSLTHSRRKEIQELIKYLNKMAEERKLYGKGLMMSVKGSLDTVLLVKKINPVVHVSFVKALSRSIEHIWGYRQIKQEITLLARMQYDSNNAEHEESLLRLWQLLKPDVSLSSRVTKQWQTIGFQGDDPKTDFRGMGVLGLDNLLFFASEYPTVVQRVLQHSLHPQYGYAFAIVGINLTSLAYHLFQEDIVKSHVFNSCKSLPTLHVFHHFYCYLFYEFDRVWMESKPCVMEFSNIKNKFENNVRSLLKDPSVQLKIDLTMDTDTTA